MRSLMTCTPHNIIWVIKSRGIRPGIWHTWVTGKLHTGFWWRKPRERAHLENLGTDKKDYYYYYYYYYYYMDTQ
jgi:hypothetical protein